MRYALIILASMAMVGCADTSEPENAKSKHSIAELRHQYFVECMTLASQVKSNEESSVNEVISQCDLLSYYQTIHLN